MKFLTATLISYLLTLLPNKKRRLCSILFLAFVFLPASADSGMAVSHYTANQGLPGNTVYCSFKDSDGFMWFGTLYGLCSFDGVTFTTYLNHDHCYYSENPPRKITAITEDKNGFLWIKTTDDKVYVFDRKKERFYTLDDEIKQYAGDVRAIKIQRTSGGEILLLTGNRKLLRAFAIDGQPADIRLLHDLSPYANENDSVLTQNVLTETDDFIYWIGKDYTLFSYRKGKSLLGKPATILAKAGIDSSESFTCAFGGEAQLWVGDNAGVVYAIDPETGNVNKYKLPDVDRAIQALAIDNTETIYACMDKRDGMYEYDIRNNRLQKLLPKLNTDAVHYVFTDEYNKIWFEEQGQALFYYDPQNKTEKRFPFPQGKPVTKMQIKDAGEKGLFVLTPSGDMWMFVRESLSMIRLSQTPAFPDRSRDLPLFFHQELDNNGMLWLSSSMGVYCINVFPKQFHLFDLQTFKKAFYAEKEDLNRNIAPLFRDTNNNIWIATGQNLYLLDKNAQLREIVMPMGRPIASVCHIMEDNQGNLWLSTPKEGLVKITPDAQSPYGFRFAHYTHNPEMLSSLSGNQVSFTFQDSKNRIWVGLSGGHGLNLLREQAGAVCFNHKYNGFKQYPAYGSYMEIRGMAEDKDGRIWVGTANGLMSFDVNFASPEEITFETYRDRMSVSGVCNDNISLIYTDTDSRIWISLFGGGLSELSGYDEAEQMPVFQSYGKNNGLRNDAIISVAEDSEQNIWFVTDRGVSRFDKQTERFRNYDENDGFPDVTTSGGNGLLLTPAGEFWLGCKEGILAFSPDKLVSPKRDYQTCIVDFKVFGKNKPTTDVAIKYADKVELEYDKSTFTIEYAALDYSNRGSISYKYMLEGYDKEWHANGSNRTVSFAGIPPGKYKFRVQSTDEINPELSPGSALEIHVLSPLQLDRWWVYSLYVLLTISIFLVASKSIMRILKAKNEIYIKRRLSELKIKFFTNVFHEIRIPLMLVKSPVQRLKRGENLSLKGKKYIELIEKNTDQMLQLINRIFDFGKLQSSGMRLNIASINLNEIMESFYKEFRTLSEKYEVAYSFHLTDERIMLWADKEKLNIAIRNIISNAFKFASVRKNITVSTGISKRGKKCYIKLEVGETGIQGNEALQILAHVPKYDISWNPYHQGKGIGLILSEELIHLHCGSVIVEKHESQVIYTIELLLGKKHYAPTEVNFCKKSDGETEQPLAKDNDNRLPEQLQEDESLQKQAEKDKTIRKRSSRSEYISNFFDNTPLILLIENNRDLADLFKWQLGDRYEVLTATNIAEGLKKINICHPDMVVIGQTFSKINVLEVLKCSRKNFRISHIPLVVLAVEGNDDSEIKLLSMGVSACVTGPMDKEYLIARLEDLLKKRQQFRERIWNLKDIRQPNDDYAHYLTGKDWRLLEKLVQVMEKNLSNSSFKIENVMPEMKLSHIAFLKKIKGLTGFTSSKLVREVRLNKSEVLLKNTDTTIPEIASIVGFKNLKEYETAFFIKHNQTPAKYRDNVQ